MIKDEEVLQTQLQDIKETDNIIKLKREDIPNFIQKVYKGFSVLIIEELMKYLTTTMKIKKTGEFKLPNVVVVRRGQKAGLDSYYTNNFKYIISSIRSWDKDIILIIN